MKIFNRTNNNNGMPRQDKGTLSEKVIRRTVPVIFVYPEYRTLIYLLNAFCATSDEPERYAALIRALNDNIDYTRRHAMHRKQKSDEPQPDGGGSE